MPTCSQILNQYLIDNLIDQIPVITPNVFYNFALTTQNKVFYKILSSINQVVTFNIQLTTQIQINNPRVTINYYKYDDINNILYYSGQTIISSLNLIFQKEIDVGVFIICISSALYSFSGKILWSGEGYSPAVRFICDQYVGDYSTSTLYTIPKPPGLCRKVLNFEMVDGKLPDGLEINKYGYISGIPTNLDCYDDNLSPSFNWYSLDSNYNYNASWGKPFTFRVKVWIEEIPSVFAYENFIILVYNNWNTDKNLFLNEIENKPESSLNPYEILKVKTIIIEPKVEDLVICECVENLITTVELKKIEYPCEIEANLKIKETGGPKLLNNDKLKNNININFYDWYVDSTTTDNLYVKNFINNLKEQTNIFEKIKELGELSTEQLLINTAPIYENRYNEFLNELSKSNYTSEEKQRKINDFLLNLDYELENYSSIDEKINDIRDVLLREINNIQDKEIKNNEIKNLEIKLNQIYDDLKQNNESTDDIRRANSISREINRRIKLMNNYRNSDDVDQIMIVEQLKENQKLPFTVEMYNGFIFSKPSLLKYQ